MRHNLATRYDDRWDHQQQRVAHRVSLSTDDGNARFEGLDTGDSSFFGRSAVRHCSRRWARIAGSNTVAGYRPSGS